MSNQQLLQQIIRDSSKPDLIKKAFQFADVAHSGQKRYSGEDYIIHPLMVAFLLNQMRLSPPTIAAAFLHDIADDTPVSMEEIEKEFGKEIAFLVSGVSKLGGLRYPKFPLKNMPIEERAKTPIDLQAENLRKMFLAMAEDVRVILIKLADRLHNMGTLNFIPPQKQKRIALETLEIFAPLANRLGMGDVKGHLEDLAFPYLYPAEFEWLTRNVKEKYEERTKYLEKVRPELAKILEKEGIKPLDMHSRAKHYWSLYQKLFRYDMNLEKIHDLVALRIIVNDIETCYRVLGAIHKTWKPLPGLIKDYIAFPKPNSYRALHTTCFCLEGKITEIQIKTPQMHWEAEYGICAHWAKKEGVDLKTQGKQFAWVAQLANWQKEIFSSQEFFESLKIDFLKNRIFIFTPKGGVIDLPEGATPVDFAYSVHTDIGDKCSGAKVNGKIVPLSQPLKNGNVVEIITEKNKRPSRDWLEFVKTSLARSQIRGWLKKESRPQNLNRGLEMLNREFRQIKGESFANISQSQTESLLKSFPYKDLESLTVAVGEGEISPREICKSLFKEEEIFTPAQPKVFPRLNLEKKGRAGVSLAGETGILINLAKCCLPQPGQEIGAYITKNRGASVHTIDCDNLIKAQKKWPQKIIEATWPEGGEKICYAVSLEIKAQDRMGLLLDVSSAISGLGINILNCQTKTQPEETAARIEVGIEISGWEELDEIFSRLRKVRGVMEIKKI